MKPDDARVESEIVSVVTANALHVKLLPTVAVFGIRRICVFLAQRRDVCFLLLVSRIDTRARRVEITLDAIYTRSFDRVEIDERAVANDGGPVVLDETDAAHVGSEAVGLGHARRGQQT